MISAIIAM